MSITKKIYTMIKKPKFTLNVKFKFICNSCRNKFKAYVGQPCTKCGSTDVTIDVKWLSK
jgi:rRNA maturation endonuclease Nob1